MNDVVRIGVIGAGGWGRNLLRVVDAHPDVSLAAICDPDETALESAHRRHPNACCFSDFDTMLKAATGTDGGKATAPLDGVILASPPKYHSEQAKAAMTVGLDVLVEKPIALNSLDAGRLHQQATAAGRILMVGHTFLYSNLVHAVKDRITSGELGDVLCLQSQRLNLGRVRTDVDALWNFAPHDISIANFLLDAWPTHVNARGHSFIQPELNIADVAFFQMEFANGPVMGGQVSWLDPLKTRRMVIVGRERMLVYDDMDAQRHIQIFDKCVEREFQASPDDFCDFRTKVRAGDVVTPHIQLVEPLHVEIDHFQTCIRNRTQCRTDARHGWMTVNVLEAMSRSMNEGGARVAVDHTPLQVVGTEKTNHSKAAADVASAIDRSVDQSEPCGVSTNGA
ncbi:MAG: Gfo/Idh/MocA family protein [Phycisphaerae bacterium]